MDEMDAEQRFLFEILSSVQLPKCSYYLDIFFYNIFHLLLLVRFINAFGGKTASISMVNVFISLFCFVVSVSGVQNSDIVVFLSVFLIVSHNHRHSHENTLTRRPGHGTTLKMAKHFLQENSCQVLKSLIFG